MRLCVHALDELDPLTLYQLLRLRADVFVVEQRCAYPDLDGRDAEPTARHCYVIEDGALVACLRILAEPDGVTRLVRIATALAARGRGHARRLVAHALEITARPVVLDAQVQLLGWYGRFGFMPEGDPFVEDGISHQRMWLR